MPVSSAAMIIDRKCGEATASSAASSFFGHPPAPLVVLPFESDEDFGAAPEWRPIQVLAPDGPVQHVPEQPERSVDGCRRQRPPVDAVHDSRLLQVGDEILDVRRLDFCEQAVAETID